MSNTAQLSAKERILSLLDDNSFVEIGALVTKRSTDFNLQQKEIPADGVITGYGVIDCNLVYVYSQDVSSLNGSIGEMHAKKIANIYDMALKVGAPVIGLIDCAGLRLQEATDALNAFGEIYLKQAMSSGVIPQIAAVFGNCGGGSAVSTSLCDFTFMTKSAKLFVNTPNTLDGNYTAKCDTADAKFQAEAGNVDFVGENDLEVINKVRELISVLPSNNEDDASFDECTDDLNREVPAFEAEVIDAEEALKDISDNNFFIGVKSGYAKEMVTGFIRLNGVTVGAVANRTAVFDENGKEAEKFEGVLTTKGCYKAEKFVKFCDAFNIPLLTITNVKGYKATVCEEKSISIAAAKLTYAFANATVPKVNVIADKAFGNAYVAMNSKHIGADMVFALPNSQIGTMDPMTAAEIMYEGDKKANINTKAEEYKTLQGSAQSAAKRGYVDSIIDGSGTRKQLIYAYEMLFTKRESRPSKKHGTV